MHTKTYFVNFAAAMGFTFHINFLDLAVKGMLIGIIASAPMGPVGVLCVQRTLNKGRWYGFATGVGAAVSDIVYALFTAFGMSFIMDFITNAQYKFGLQIAGSLLLLAFGVYCYRSDPTKGMHVSGKTKNTLLHNGVTAFLVAFSNPFIVLLFIAAFAQLAFVIPNHPAEMTMGYVSIFAGACLWWFGLTWLVDKIRAKFDDSGIIIINRIIGCLVVVFSVVILIGTVFNLYTIEY